MKATIRKIIRENHRVLTFVVEPEKPVSFKTGQAMKWNLPGLKLGRLFSVAIAGGENISELWFTIAIVSDGRFTPNLLKLKGGDKIELQGPFGKFIFEDGGGNDVALIAGGTGISVLRSILYHVLEKDSDVKIHLLFSILTKDDTIYKDELKKLAQDHNNFTYSMVVTDEHPEWQGRCGFVTKEMSDQDFGDYHQEFYICGPKPFIICIEEILKKANVPEERIHIEQW
jgi:NAD(P)H-flavin reductase